MTTEDRVTELLKDLEAAERLADHGQILEIVSELGNLEENAVMAIPSLLPLFKSHYNVPTLRDAFKTAFQKIGFDINSFEPVEKLRNPTRLLLLFGLILLNGSFFAWGSAQFYPFNYLRPSEFDPMFMELLSPNHVVILQGNYDWVLATFLITAIYYSLYLGYLLYIARSFSSFSITSFWTSFGLLAPIFGLLFGIISVDQTLSPWITLSSKESFQGVVIIGFFSFFWSGFVNIQFSSFANGFLRGTLGHLPPAKTYSSLRNNDT